MSIYQQYLKSEKETDSSATLDWSLQFWLLLPLQTSPAPSWIHKTHRRCWRPASSQLRDKRTPNSTNSVHSYISITTSLVGVNKDVITLLPAEKETDPESCHVWSGTPRVHKSWIELHMRTDWRSTAPPLQEHLVPSPSEPQGEIILFLWLSMML